MSRFYRLISFILSGALLFAGLVVPTLHASTLSQEVSMFLVKPEYHIRAPKRSELLFDQDTARPRAIQAWCYQGSNYFNDFLYAK